MHNQVKTVLLAAETRLLYSWHRELYFETLKFSDEFKMKNLLGFRPTCDTTYPIYLDTN